MATAETGDFPVLGTENVLKRQESAFPDLETGTVLKAFPDIEIGQVIKIHGDDLGEPHPEGDQLSLVILTAEAGGEGLRVGAVLQDPDQVADAVSELANVMGALDVTVVEDVDWAVAVTVTDIHPTSDDEGRRRRA